MIVSHGPDARSRCYTVQTAVSSTNSLAFSFVGIRFVLGLELEAWVNRSEEHFAIETTLVDILSIRNL
jgi:hypothetical protein